MEAAAAISVADSTEASTYTMSIARHGGRSEAGALTIEGKFEGLSGVYEAAVSFRIESVRIAYDPELVSTEEIRDSPGSGPHDAGDSEGAPEDDRHPRDRLWHDPAARHFLPLAVVGEEGLSC